MRWKRILQALFFALAVGFLVWMVAEQWEAIRAYD